MPPACEVLLRRLEHVTARLLDLNPTDVSALELAIANRAAAIEDLLAWAASRETSSPLDPEFAARLQESLTTGSAIALRLTLARLDLSAQLSSLTREKRLLDALTDAGARTPGRTLDYSG